MTSGFDAVSTAEHERIKAQREVRRVTDEAEYAGIAISGGGIRSASFAMGVLQALAKESYIKQFDYLSTVSGGGYIGSAWSWYSRLYRQGKLGPKQDYFFPFGDEHEGARKGKSVANQILSYIRQHGNYLVPGAGIDLVSGLSVVVRNMIQPMLVYTALLTSLFCVLLLIEQTSVIDQTLAQFEEAMGYRLNVAMSLALFLGFASLVSGVLYGVLTYFLSTSVFSYQLRTRVQQIIGYVVYATLALLVLGLIPLLITTTQVMLYSTPGGLLGIGVGVWYYTREQRHVRQGLPSNVVAVIASILFIFALLAVTYWIAYRFLSVPFLIATGLFGLGLGWFINLNQFGLGRMYRDRLMETFLPDPDAVRDEQWQLAEGAAVAKLPEFCTEQDQGPYHLLNTNLILVDSENKKYQGRGGDNFILSPLYCGSNATGWIPAENFDAEGLTLSTAMATSGAAVNPHAGPNSTGVSKNPLISFLMFFLGLRLGLFVLNPTYKAYRGLNSPNFIWPGLLHGLLGIGINMRSRFLTLSDGGHFENTATYELIRRRVKLIVTSEAGQDQDFTFADIANLVEKVRVDFGVHIRFLPDYDLQFVMPGSAHVPPYYGERYQMAERGFAVARVYYPETDMEGEEPGWLFVVKATMINDLPADIYGYKDAHPEFPNQSTADQFFGEVQLESYRELGYQLARRMCEDGHFVTAVDSLKQKQK